MFGAQYGSQEGGKHQSHELSFDEDHTRQRVYEAKDITEKINLQSAAQTQYLPEAHAERFASGNVSTERGANVVSTGPSRVQSILRHEYSRSEEQEAELFPDVNPNMNIHVHPAETETSLKNSSQILKEDSQARSPAFKLGPKLGEGLASQNTSGFDGR